MFIKLVPQVYNLPTSSAKDYPALFEDLDKNKLKLDFLNLGLSVTTMEDVFLRFQLLIFSQDKIHQVQYKNMQKAVTQQNQKIPGVVYFDQRLGAAHPKHWQKQSNQHFRAKKLKNAKKQQIWSKILQKNSFFDLAPKHWQSVLLPKKQLFSFYL